MATTTQTLRHVPAPGKGAGLTGTALCGAWARYASGDHGDLTRIALSGGPEGYCPGCYARAAADARGRLREAEQRAAEQRQAIRAARLAEVEVLCAAGPVGQCGGVPIYRVGERYLSRVQMLAERGVEA